MYTRLGTKASIALRDAADKINLYNLSPKKAGPVTMSIPNQPPGPENPEAELHKLAPTLADLRELPPEQKDRLLLAQLTKMSKRNESILNKHNLTMSGDPYGMARFYPESEKREVVEHLLAAPWTRLVNNGFLADFSGRGFYKVTAEGHEYLKQESTLHATPTPSDIPVTLPARIEGTPRVFIGIKDNVISMFSDLNRKLIKEGYKRMNFSPGTDPDFQSL